MQGTLTYDSDKLSCVWGCICEKKGVNSVNSRECVREGPEWLLVNRQTWRVDNIVNIVQKTKRFDKKHNQHVQEQSLSEDDHSDSDYR